MLVLSRTCQRARSAVSFNFRLKLLKTELIFIFPYFPLSTNSRVGNNGTNKCIKTRQKIILGETGRMKMDNRTDCCSRGEIVATLEKIIATI